MKQVTILLLSVFFALTGCSVNRYVRQAEELIKDGELKGAREKIEMAIDTTGKKQWARTYLVYGKLARTSAVSKKKKDRNLFTDPLKLAYENYLKASKIDKKGKLDNSLKILLPQLSNDFVNKGVDAFKKSDFREAMISFEYVCEIAKEGELVEPVDTGIIYNAGLAAYNAKIYDRAIKHFTTCKQMNYGGSNVYILLKDIYISTNDSANALNILKEAYNKFPEEDDVLYQLVNYYITANMNHKALSLLEIAKEKDPDNAHNLFAEGLIYDRIGEIRKAETAYKKSIELDPDFFTSQYNLGALLFNQGVVKVEEANKILDNEKYMEAREAADKKFAEALPYLEKAHDLNKRDIETMETLKLIYYRLKMMEKHSVIDSELQNLKRKN